MVRIMINYENNAEDWWANGGGELWDRHIQTRDKYGYLNLDEKTAIEFVKEAEDIPHWFSQETPYAPFPVTFQNEDGDNLSYENETFVVC